MTQAYTMFPVGEYVSQVYYDGNHYDVHWTQKLCSGNVVIEIHSVKWDGISVIDLFHKSVINFKEDFFEVLFRRSKQIIPFTIKTTNNDSKENTTGVSVSRKR